MPLSGDLDKTMETMTTGIIPVAAWLTGQSEQRLRSRFRGIKLEILSETPWVTGNIHCRKSDFDIIVNYALLRFNLHCDVLFEGDKSYDGGTEDELRFPNILDDQTKKIIESGLEVYKPDRQGLSREDMVLVMQGLLRSFWSGEYKKLEVDDYLLKLNSTQLELANRRVAYTLLFTVSRELARASKIDAIGDLRNSQFGEYTDIAHTYASEVIKPYIERARANEVLHEILEDRSENQVVESWRNEFAYDVMGAYMATATAKVIGDKEDHGSALATLAFDAVELALATSEMLDKYFARNNSNGVPIGYFKGHPFGRNRYDFVRLWSKQGILPKSEGKGELWRKRCQGILDKIEEEDKRDY